MSTAPAPAEKTLPPKRAWYRLHFSTWAAMLLMMGVMVIVEVPGEYSEDATRAALPIFDHGWPWICVKRQLEFPTPVQKLTLDIGEDGVKAPWLVPDAWCYENFKVSKFSLPNLLLDLAVAFAIVLAAGGLFEWRRRKRFRLFQFTLRELCLLMLLTAGVLSWWQTERRQRIYERELIAENGMDRYFGEERYAGPAVLAKLIGLENLSDFYRRDACTLYEPSPEAVGKMLPLVKNIHRLKRLTIHQAVNIGDENLAEISGLKDLEALYLYDAKITDFGMVTISGFSRLEKLNVCNAKLTDASVPALGRLSRLKILDISGTKITEEGERKLKALLPRCIILHEAFS